MNMDGFSISFRTAFAYWVKLGFMSFGGPAGQIAMMQTEVVDRRGWVDQGTFLRGLNYCMLLPGPEAQQLATYIGWRLHGTWGGIAAGCAFILPGAVIMVFLAWLAAAHGDAAVIAAAFSGIKPVVIAIVGHALWRIAKRTLDTVGAWALAGSAFVAIYFLGISFPLVVLAAAIVGMVSAGVPGLGFGSGRHPEPAAHGAQPAPPVNGHLRRLGILFSVFAALWAVPVVGAVVLGGEPFADVARLFTTAAFVTFGGAYAVLPYIAEAGVETYGWLSPGEMINGLALAETTPGPLILVTTYVGYFAGWSAGGAVGPGPAFVALFAAGLTTLVTFLPSFLFILAGAPLHRAPAGQSLCPQRPGGDHGGRGRGHPQSRCVPGAGGVRARRRRRLDHDRRRRPCLRPVGDRPPVRSLAGCRRIPVRRRLRPSDLTEGDRSNENRNERNRARDAHRRPRAGHPSRRAQEAGLRRGPGDHCRRRLA
jgi:chromate transporter